MSSGQSLKRTSMAIPAQLLEWLDREAVARGKSRNSLITYLLEQTRDVQVVERLQKLESIVNKLQERLS